LPGEAVAVALSAVLLVTVVGALWSTKTSTALIMMFYASIMMGVVFTLYSDALLGLVLMVTFAGAISVLFLSVILMTGEPSLDLGARRLASVLAAATAAVAGASLYSLVGAGTQSSGEPADISLSLLTFMWSSRPWDLLIMMVVFASSMVAVVGLLSRER
jgi:hypothetical protein